jgi:hypothetical protein
MGMDGGRKEEAFPALLDTTQGFGLWNGPFERRMTWGFARFPFMPFQAKTGNVPKVKFPG